MKRVNRIWHDSHSTRRFGKVQQRVSANRRLERLAAALLIVSIVAFCGCIASPEGASCTHCKKSFPYDLSLDIPWIGGDNSPTECGSACEPTEGEQTTCDELAPEEVSANVAAENYSYEQVIDSLFVQPASTVVFSTVSIAGSAFGTFANYCLPVAALGPPESVPPGRFHPVPTRPVFAERG
jgi:hypothetical protein